MDLILPFIQAFLHLTKMVLPFFIMGIAFGALLESTVAFNFIYRYLNSGKRSIVYAAILGGLLPGCACATIPMAEGIRRRGASIATVGAFMLTSPLLAPQTIILTYGMLGLSFTIARIVFALFGGILIGAIFHVLSNMNMLAMPEYQEKPVAHTCCPPSGVCHNESHPRPSFLNSFVSITKKLSLYFFIGMVIASLLTVLVPVEWVPNTIGTFPTASYVIATVIGIPIYVCEGEEIPVTYSLLALGLANGPAFTFMMGAVGTCIPTLLFAKQLIGKKPVVIYGLFWIIFAPMSGLLFSMIFM